MRLTRLGMCSVLASLILATGCGGQHSLETSAGGYDTAEQVPHPGLAEGRPVITIPMQGTHYACPPLRQGEPTPLLTDACLTPEDAATTRLGDYWQLQASVPCPDGRSVTSAGLIGVGFVGEPLLPAGGPEPERDAIEACLRESDRG
jgi:hypothetical protein